MYRNYEELEKQAARLGGLAQAVLADEMQLSEKNEDDIYTQLAARWLVMRAAAEKALDTPQQMPGNLISGLADKQQSYAGNAMGGYCGQAMNLAMAYALSNSEVNAAMGRICAAPTAGACGVLPAVLLTALQRHSEQGPPIEEEDLLDALLVAGGVGAIITRNATVSGAEGGCQAECGTAAAMAAAAAVVLAGGTAAMAGNAISIALMNCMGLVCDPVAGLVQLPCAYRNASQTVNALLSADLALAGQDAVIPADEAIEAMARVGRAIPPSLRETAMGGIATTATGQRIRQELQLGDL